LTVERLCALAKLSRAGFYRHPSGLPKADRDMALRDALQRIALEFPSYGWPRMTVELKRRGWAVNHKRVYRLMREDNLLCLRKRKFVLTTDSDHGLPVYPNLARRMTLTGLDQLWVADLTYIRLELEFVYLAVILDAFSRRVIGWALDRRLDTELTLQALRRALGRRRADTVPMIDYFTRLWAKDFGRPQPPMTETILEACLRYDWPGNVRELENLVKRWLIFNDEAQALSHLQGHSGLRPRVAFAGAL
jgi:transposase InsO family protein